MGRDYSKGKVYCVKVNTKEEYLPYVGSTTKQYLSQRMENHRRLYDSWKNKKSGYTAIFELFERYGVENCYIELLELYSCNCNDELRKKEREWFDKVECVNIVRPYVSEEESKGRVKKWMGENKEERQIYMKNYREKNYDKLLQNKRDYKIKNAEKIKEQMKERYVCICGAESILWNKARHDRTKKHLDYLTTIETLCSTTIA
jgi:hypothetical protein